MTNTDADAFPKVLRQAAVVESNYDLQYSLRGAADLIEGLIDDLHEFQSAAAMQDLNGAWAHAWKLLQLSREPKKEKK